MRLSLLAVIALILSSFAARADTVYTYTGQDFTTVSGAFTTKDHVTGYFTVSAPLPTNSNLSLIGDSYSFSDGLETLTNSNAPDYLLVVSTDANGSIYRFYVIVTNNGDPTIKLDDYGAGYIGDSVSSGLNDGQNTVAGTFTEQTTVAPTAVTPEPTSITLFGTGLLGIAGVVRKRLA